jgi:hypothetical protein
LRDEFGVVWSMPDDQMLYMDISVSPLADATIKDVENYPFPDGDPLSIYGVRERPWRCGRTSLCSIVRICGVTYEGLLVLRGLERWFMDMIKEIQPCARR